MKICDRCGSKLVLEGKLRPHCYVFGANNFRYETATCGICGEERECVERHDYPAYQKPITQKKQ